MSISSKSSAAVTKSFSTDLIVSMFSDLTGRAIEEIRPGFMWLSRCSSVRFSTSTRNIGDKISQEKRYYISSLSKGYDRIHRGIRDHWSIENSLHWVLDICFDEDQCRKRIKNSAANISAVRKIAINMIKNETSYKSSVVGKILKAGRNTVYLKKVLGF